MCHQHMNGVLIAAPNGDLPLVRQKVPTLEGTCCSGENSGLPAETGSTDVTPTSMYVCK